ncbi:hypothetical protein D3C73_1113690 [compost metagenome]
MLTLNKTASKRKVRSIPVKAFIRGICCPMTVSLPHTRTENMGLPWPPWARLNKNTRYLLRVLYCSQIFDNNHLSNLSDINDAFATS